MRRTLVNTLALMLAPATTALAATGSGGGMGWLGMVFLGFGALIVAFQLIPAIVLFGSMLKGLFTTITAKTALATGKKEHKAS